MQKTKPRLLGGALKGFHGILSSKRQTIIFEWMKHFVQSVKVLKEQLLFVLSDGHSSHRNTACLNCYCMYKRTSDAMFSPGCFLKMQPLLLVRPLGSYYGNHRRRLYPITQKMWSHNCNVDKNKVSHFPKQQL